MCSNGYKAFQVFHIYGSYWISYACMREDMRTYKMCYVYSVL